MSRIEPFLQESTTGFLHVPSEPVDPHDWLAQANRNRGLVLTHGAGGNCQAPVLVAVANAFADAGFHVLRCDLAFRKRRRSGPPHPSQAAEDRSGLLADVNVMRGIVSGRIHLGGHSYGGRQASILVSENASVCDGLLLLSYPLHPPNKPGQLRTAHFTKITIPSLFVHGTKDPFGTVEELGAALKLISGPTKLSILENAGHDLSRGRFDIASIVVEPLCAEA